MSHRCSFLSLPLILPSLLCHFPQPPQLSHRCCVPKTLSWKERVTQDPLPRTHSQEIIQYIPHLPQQPQLSHRCSLLSLPFILPSFIFYLPQPPQLSHRCCVPKTLSWEERVTRDPSPQTHSQEFLQCILHLPQQPQLSYRCSLLFLTLILPSFIFHLLQPPQLSHRCCFPKMLRWEERVP